MLNDVTLLDRTVFNTSATACSTITAFGQTIAASFGIVYLPKPYGAFPFSAATTSFTRIGR